MIEYKDKTIPLEAIVISPVHHTRPVTAEDKKEIGASLAKFGQLQQLVVRPVKGKRKDMYELLAGRKRFEGMKAEGIKTARCAVTKADDRTAELLSIVENLHRRHEDEATRRRELARYTELVAEDIQRQEKVQAERHRVSGTVPKPKVGRPRSAEREVVKRVAEDLPVSEEEVRKIQQLQKNLCPSACRALDRKKITLNQAIALSRMPLGKQRDELQKMVNESQHESEERLARERMNSVGPTEATCQMLKKVLTVAENLYQKTDELTKYTHGKAIDWEAVQKVSIKVGEEEIDYTALKKAGNALLDLQGVIDTA